MSLPLYIFLIRVLILTRKTLDQASKSAPDFLSQTSGERVLLRYLFRIFLFRVFVPLPRHLFGAVSSL